MDQNEQPNITETNLIRLANVFKKIKLFSALGKYQLSNFEKLKKKNSKFQLKSLAKVASKMSNK